MPCANASSCSYTTVTGNCPRFLALCEQAVFLEYAVFVFYRIDGFMSRMLQFKMFVFNKW